MENIIWYGIGLPLHTGPENRQEKVVYLRRCGEGGPGMRWAPALRFHNARGHHFRSPAWFGRCPRRRGDDPEHGKTRRVYFAQPGNLQGGGGSCGGRGGGIEEPPEKTVHLLIR